MALLGNGTVNGPAPCASPRCPHASRLPFLLLAFCLVSLCAQRRVLSAEPNLHWLEVAGEQTTSTSGSFEVQASDEFWIVVEMENESDAARRGGITVSLPYFDGTVLDCTWETGGSTGEGSYVMYREEGDTSDDVYDKNGDTVNPVEDAIFECCDMDWWDAWGLNGENQRLKIKLRARSSAETFSVYVRGWLCEKDTAWTVHSRNPSSGGYTDQQGYGCYRYTVSVVEPDTTPPTVPSLDSPSNGAYTDDRTVSLDWSTSSDSDSGLDYYQVQVDDSSSFSSPEFDETPSSSSDTTSSLGDDRWYWRVRARDNAGNWSAWSSSRYFTVDDTNPSAPSLTKPANGSPITDQTPYFDWSAASDSTSGVDYYEIDVYDKYLTWGDLNDTTTATHYTPSSNIPYDRIYWRVRAIDNAGNVGNWSTEWWFDLEDLSKPDLQITSMKMAGSIAVDQHFDPGESISLDFLGYNAGDATSTTNVQMKCYWGTSSGAKTNYIATEYFGSLNGLSPGEEEWANVPSWNVPQDGGEYWLTGVIDTDGANDEGDNEGNNEITRRFYVDEPGTITVTIQPSSAVSSGARWHLTSGPDQGEKQSGASASVPADTYTITFNTPAGWGSSSGTRPADIDVGLSAGESISQSGTYRRIKSAYWRDPKDVPEGTTATMSAEVEGFSVGEQFKFEVYEGGFARGALATKYGNVISDNGKLYVRAEWVTEYHGDWGIDPDPEYYFRVSHSGADVYRESATDLKVRKSTGTIGVAISPASAIAGGAKWKLASGPNTAWHTSGEQITVPVGSYTITFNSPSGWGTPSGAKPADITDVSVVAGATVSRTGAYHRIVSAQWDETQKTVVEGTSVTMKAVVEGFATGTQFTFTITEGGLTRGSYGPLYGTCDATGIVTCEWGSVWEDDGLVGDPEYYFTLTNSTALSDGVPSSVSLDSATDLTVQRVVTEKRIISAYWEEPKDVMAGTRVTGTAEVSGYTADDLADFSIVIEESDSLFRGSYSPDAVEFVVDGGHSYVRFTWTAQWEDDSSGTPYNPPEYQFTISNGSVSKTSNDDLEVRKKPHVTALNVFDPAGSDVTNWSVPFDVDYVTYKLVVQNDGTADRSVTATLQADRSQGGTIDFTAPAQTYTIPSGAAHTFEFSQTNPAVGTWYAKYAVTSESVPVVTSGWEEKVTVDDIPEGTIEILSVTPSTGVERGDEIQITARVTSHSNQNSRSFWVGLSLTGEPVRDWPEGWYDVYPKPTEMITTDGHEDVTFTFTVPDWMPSGNIRAGTAAWEGYDASQHEMLPPTGPYDSDMVVAFNLPDQVAGGTLFSHLRDFCETTRLTGDPVGGRTLEARYADGKKTLVTLSVSVGLTREGREDLESEGDRDERVGVTGTMLIDACDLFGTTAEGMDDDDGWVTVWIDGTVGIGVGYSLVEAGAADVGFGIHAMDFGTLAEADVRSAIGASGPGVSIFGNSFTLFSVDENDNLLPPSFAFGFETELSVNLLSETAQLVRYEIRRDLLRDQFLMSVPHLAVVNLHNVTEDMMDRIQTIIDNGVESQVRLPGTDDDGSWPPDTPTVESPIGGVTVASLTPTLQASVFDDPEGDGFDHSQWQVADDPAFGLRGLVWDTGETHTPVTQVTVLDGELQGGTTYYWRVRYQDTQGKWSAYQATPGEFRTPDATAPGAPQALAVTPSTWSNQDTFNVSWTNPDDASGIAGAYWKVGGAPTSATDGSYVGGAPPFNINMDSLGLQGEYGIYIWLKDGAGNADHANRTVGTIRYDSLAPASVHSPDGNTVTLEAVDRPTGGANSAVAAIHYRKNGGGWGLYTDPFTAAAGDTIDYYATDNAGNDETPPNSFQVGSESPTAVIESITPNPADPLTDTLQFRDGSYDNDEDGASIVAWQWRSDLGDCQGNMVLSTAQNPDIAANDLQVGTHAITLWVQDNEGSTDTVTETLEVINATPVIDAADVTLGGDAVQVTGSAHDCDECNTEVEGWELHVGGPDGYANTVTVSGEGLSESLSTAGLGPGTYTVTVTARDDEGALSDPVVLTFEITDDVTLHWDVVGSGIVERSPLGTNDQSPSASGSSDYESDASVTVTAAPATKYRFSHWSGDVRGSSSPGQTAWSALSVQPADPGTADDVVLGLGGTWSDGGVPNALTADVTGNTIAITATRNYPPDTVFTQVLTPWSLETSLVGLPAGEYQVTAELVSTDGGSSHAAQPAGSFVVADTTTNPITVTLSESVAITAHFQADSVGDLNGDEVVDVFDLVLVSGSFGRNAGDGLSPPWTAVGEGSAPDVADVNDDGVVDLFDLVIVSGEFGKETR